MKTQAKRVFPHSLTVVMVVVGIAFAFSLGGTFVAYSAIPTVQPERVDITLGPGESFVVNKTVEVPVVPPKLDLFLLVDLTGSYRDDLPVIKSLAPGIFDGVRASVPDSAFGLGSFKDFPFTAWGASTDYAYQLHQDMTFNKTTWVNAVNAMSASGGFDGPESQYEALFQTATGAGRDVPPNGTSLGDVPSGQNPSLRAGATKIVAITTDNRFHTPGDSTCTSPSPCPFGYPGPSQVDTHNALIAAGIKVLAIKAPGSGSEMDAVAAATGGVVKTTSSNSTEIADAILSAIVELTFDITGQAEGCDPLQISFEPPVLSNVTGGALVTFRETIAVPDDTPPQEIHCEVVFKADGTVIGIQEVWVIVLGGKFLLIDEDSIDNGNPPNFFSDTDVNDHIADIGLRTQLPFFAANVGSNITLYTGEVGDEGWFALKSTPASWAAAGPTNDSLRNYVLAGPGLGSEDADGDREALLDKVPDVTPLRATGLKQLEGQTVCAVVYDSDIGINYDPLDGSLKGDNLGTVAFEVVSVTDLTGFSSSSLPQVQVLILDADVVCEGSLELFTDAPEPTSSSEPFDVSVKGEEEEEEEEE